MKRLVIYIITALFLAAFILAGIDYSKQFPSRSEYKVCTEWVNQLLTKLDSIPIDTILLSQEPSTLSLKQFPSIKETVLESIKVDSTTWFNFIEKSRDTSLWSNKFSFSIPYALIPKNEADSLYSSTQELDINRMIQNGGVKWFSRVGFNRNKTEALFYYQGIAGPLAGRGTLVVMRKTHGKWKMFFEHTLWVS